MFRFQQFLAERWPKDKKKNLKKSKATSEDTSPLFSFSSLSNSIDSALNSTFSIFSYKDDSKTEGRNKKKEKEGEGEKVIFKKETFSSSEELRPYQSSSLSIPPSPTPPSLFLGTFICSIGLFLFCWEGNGQSKECLSVKEGGKEEEAD